MDPNAACERVCDDQRSERVSGTILSVSTYEKGPAERSVQAQSRLRHNPNTNSPRNRNVIPYRTRSEN